MRVTRWVLGIAGAVLIAWCAYRVTALGWLGAAMFDCSNETLSEAVSSDGVLTATVFERNCSATTPFVRIVSVRATTAAFDADAENRQLFVIEGQPDVQVAWTASAPYYLSVKFGSGEIVKQALIWYGVVVSYD